MAENRVIKEIICLKSIEHETGRPRVLKPGDMEGDLWDRQVEAALADTASYEIHREVVYTEEAETEDLSKIEVKEMFGMGRERVAEIAFKVHGIKDEGQTRTTLIDQITSEMGKQAALEEKLRFTAPPKSTSKTSVDDED